jgi:hypothetical protein
VKPKKMQGFFAPIMPERTGEIIETRWRQKCRRYALVIYAGFLDCFPSGVFLISAN